MEEHLGTRLLAKLNHGDVLAIEDFLSLFDGYPSEQYCARLAEEFGVGPMEVGLILGRKVRRAELNGEKWPRW